MPKGEVYRNLRNPQVARDRESGKAVITINGEEDEFVVLQMSDGVAADLTLRLIMAGYGAPK